MNFVFFFTKFGGKEEMKKYLLSLFLIFFVSSLFAGTYLITSPTPEEKWLKLGIHKIKWLVLGDNTERVNILLYSKDGSKKILDIAKNIKNTGEFICNLETFKDVSDGEYRIFIVSPEGNVLGESKLFKIVTKISPKPDKKIRVLSPSIPLIITPGKFINIEWETQKKLPKNFLVELYTSDKTKKVLLIKRMLPPLVGIQKNKLLKKRHYKFKWIVPNTLPQGEYIIKISVPDKNIKTFTPLIKINREEIKKDVRRHQER